ncbi:unnamed protein product [Lactuca saligna]|uniref:Uncharacterized protein n=1 Tax=Lactuca saligna TaxID=75948 RepID=A0AA36ECV1_LACSI|nr:unnamed protein product [Lactuca saligna]
MIEDETEEDHGGTHDVGPEVEQDEYVIIDFEYEESDQELDKEKGIEEARSEPHQLKAPSDSRTVQRVDKNYLHSLEEEIISLKLQLITAKERDV